MATLIINRFDTKCGACGKSADFRETNHLTVLGYGEPTIGCGVKWTHVSSGYTNMKESVTKLRPDLIPGNFWEL